MEDWNAVSVPTWTCLLYVDVPGEYKCTVDGSNILFHVQGLFENYIKIVQVFELLFCLPLAPCRRKGIGLATEDGKIK